MATSDQELLARSIQASGLTTGDYARQVLAREPRLVRRWLAGTLEIPTIVREHLERLEKERLEKERLEKERLEEHPPIRDGQLGLTREEWEAFYREFMKPIGGD